MRIPLGIVNELEIAARTVLFQQAQDQARIPVSEPRSPPTRLRIPVPYCLDVAELSSPVQIYAVTAGGLLDETHDVFDRQW